MSYPVTEQLSFFKEETQKKRLFHEMCESLCIGDEPRWPDRFGSALRRWSTKNVLKPIRTLSLFSGAGGLDIGFHDSGFSVQKMLEVDKRFAETLKYNSGSKRFFEKAEVLCMDIRDYHPPKDFSIDFIIGGPPCQTFSAAGRRAAGVLGTSDERGSLFEEYVRILKALSPQGFLFENVYGLTGAQNGTAWKSIQLAFEQAGYRLFHRILDAADFGVPQHRERLFIVGVKEGNYMFPQPSHGPDSNDNQPFYSPSEAITGLTLTEDERNASVGGRFGELLPDIPPGMNYSFYTEKMGHPNPIFAWRSKFSDFIYKADPSVPIRTLKAQGGQYTGPFHWENRRFTIAELKRLQTIPDDYHIVGGKQTVIHQIGNSVPPQIARILALSVLGQVFNIGLPFDLPLINHDRVLGFRKRKRELTLRYKKKAIDAIDSNPRSVKVSVPQKRCYKASLLENFAWVEEDKTGGAMIVGFVPSETQWKIRVSRWKQRGHKFSIVVTQAPTKPWNLKTKKVLLVGEETAPEIFIAVWKAFESAVIRSGAKADLVQLCGYYQYPPAIRGIMRFSKGDAVSKEWEVLQAVVNGTGVGQILSVEDLSRVWNVSVQEVSFYASYLKNLAYEVRNQNTNPQIPKDHYLIPYSFPTLNPVSVQVRKSLGGTHAQK